VVSGDCLLAICMTEPDAGTDVASYKTNVDHVGNRLRLNGVKTLSYAANMLAARRAVEAGYDEALLVRSDGTVLEGPTCSVFWVRHGRLRTPALGTGILASITRRLLLESLSVEEGTYSFEEVATAEEAFLASTARNAQPIAAIGESTLAQAPGPLTLRAQEVLERAIAEGAVE